MTAEDSDDDMEDVEEGIPMQGEDGQHYVVLEVRSGLASKLERWCLLRTKRKSTLFACFRWSNCLSKVVSKEWSKLGLDPVAFNLPPPGFLCSSMLKEREKKQAGGEGKQFTILQSYGHNIDINYSIIEIGLFTFWQFLLSTSRSFSLLGEGSVILPPIMEVAAHAIMVHVLFISSPECYPVSSSCPNVNIVVLQYPPMFTAKKKNLAPAVQPLGFSWKKMSKAQARYQPPITGGTRGHDGHFQPQCWRHQDQERAGEGKLLWIWCKNFNWNNPPFLFIFIPS